MFSIRRNLISAVTLLGLATLGACASTMPDRAAAMPAATQTAAGHSAAAQTAAMQAKSAETAQMMFNDNNVAAVLTAVNLAEIRPSHVALDRTRNPVIQRYAIDMIEQHSNVQEQMQQLLAAKGLVPEHNALSLQLTNNLDPTLASLRAVPARQFDEDYVLQQVAAHEHTIHSLDTTLIPATRDPQMREFLIQTVRPAIADHLVRIKQIHHDMFSPQT